MESKETGVRNTSKTGSYIISEEGEIIGVEKPMDQQTGGPTKATKISKIAGKEGKGKEKEVEHRKGEKKVVKERKRKKRRTAKKRIGK